MSLAVGTKAPDFSLPSKFDGDMQIITLSKYTEICNVVLLFFPMAFTDTCTEEMCSVSKDYARYVDLGAVVLGISGDNPFAQAVWAEKEGISFPLLSDYEHKITQQYGVAYESFLPQCNLPMGNVAKRAAFVVDTHRHIQYAECLEDARELPDFDAISAKLRELQVPD